MRSRTLAVLAATFAQLRVQPGGQPQLGPDRLASCGVIGRRPAATSACQPSTMATARRCCQARSIAVGQ